MNSLPPDVAERTTPTDAPANGATPVAASPDFQDYLDRFLSRKWLALGVFLAVLGLTALSIVRTAPVYEARATLLLKSNEESNVFGRSNFLFPSGPNRGNFIELLRSRRMAELVAERLPDSLKLAPEQLQGMISARSKSETDILQLVATAGDTATAVRVANTYMDVSQQYDLDQGRADITQVRTFVDSQLVVVGARLDSAERVLAQFKSEHRLTGLDAGTSIVVGQRSELAAAYRNTKIEAEVSRAQLAYVQKRMAEEGLDVADRLEGISSPVVSNLKATLNQLEVQKVNLMTQGFGDSSDQVQSLDRQIDSARARLRAESQVLVAQQGFVDPLGSLSSLFQSALDIDAGQAANSARQEALADAIASSDAALARLPETERVLARLTMAVETERRVHSMLTGRREEARIQEVGRVSSVQIVDPARTANRTKPNVQSSVSFGLAMALVLAFIAVWVADRIDTSIRNPEQMERRGFPVLAGIPEFERTGPRHRRRREELASHLITHSDAKSSDAEAFRMLRTSLSFAAVDRPLKTIAVTSAVPSEGKSTVATNLAAVLAQAGWRVLLVDADLRHPVLHGVFERERKPGMTDLILSGGAGDEAIAGTMIERLSFLPGGTTPPSPADLLISPATPALLRRLSAEYDYVIIDTAPVLVAADTPILASLVDATIVVVRAGKTAVPAVENTRAALLNTGARLAGFVLNGVDPKGRRGRYYYYYKYHYYHQPTDAVAPKEGNRPA